jgi:lysophosphatidate acyltransferase
MSFLAWAAVLLVFYVVLVVTLCAFGSRMPALGFYGRLLASWGCLFLCAIYGVFASIVLRIIGYPGLSQWTVARAFKWTMLLATGTTFDIDGEENLRTRPAVFIGNHQTELDVLMLGCIFPPYCSVTAKKSLKWIPFLGWFMALSSRWCCRADEAGAPQRLHVSRGYALICSGA